MKKMATLACNSNNCENPFIRDNRITPVLLHRIFKRHVLKGHDLMKLVFIGSSGTFLSEIGTLSSLIVL